MFETLALAVEEVSIPAEADALAEALGLLDRLTAKITAALGRFDREGGWAEDGAVSLRAWLRDRAADAGRLAATARRLDRLPVLAAAWANGEMSGGQVRAVMANVAERHVALFAEHEAEVVPAVAPLGTADTARAMGQWAARADAVAEAPLGAGDSEPERALRLSPTLEGRFVLDGSLDAEGGAVVSRALALADANDFSVPAPVRRGQALVDIARFFLDHAAVGSTRRRRPHLNVVVSAGDLATGGPGELLDEGVAVDGATVGRLLCDSAVNRVLVGPSAVLDYGTSTRTIPSALWSAMAVRDRHCRFPGCDRPPAWCEGHHVRWVQHGGPTSLDNLVLLCARHHHVLHATKGMEAKLLPDGTFSVAWPDGRHLTSRPPPGFPLGPPAWPRRRPGRR